MFSVVHSQASGDITCMNGQANNIAAADWLSLGDQMAAAEGHSLLANNDPINLASGFSLGAPSSASFVVGTARAFIQQPSLTESTHVSFADFSAAIDQAREQCCGNFATCVSAIFNVKGDTGEDVQAGIVAA
ncbi:hypothetical protein B0A55_07696 [Friedmanniomyces simplex]|uniref:Uncharacterized protein n=1 Tax=Friedmanniomyces simplex TaxID=329884 RepID=A0A4U0X8F0_9PEZI|nr:hypothetical protein B0A55_07696 [Friedmanniomyces simplex]